MIGLIKKLLLVLAVVSAAFGLGIGYSYWQQTTQNEQQFEHCEQLQEGKCTWNLAKQQWQLSLPSNNLPAMLVQTIELISSESNPPPLLLTLQGKDMYMGEVSVNLSPEENGHYQAELLLPICNTGKMRWRAEIISLDSERPLALSFEVDSQ
ncbi:hypothetical protein ACVFI8_06845 [Agarivorans sp. MS3-6]